MGFIENNDYMEMLYANVVLRLINLNLTLKNELTSILYLLNRALNEEKNKLLLN